MKSSDHTAELIVRKLREADLMLGEGQPMGEVYDHLDIEEHTYYWWRNRYRKMKADDGKRLNDLENENQRLNRIRVDQAFMLTYSKR